MDSLLAACCTPIKNKLNASIKVCFFNKNKTKNKNKTVKPNPATTLMLQVTPFFRRKICSG